MKGISVGKRAGGLLLAVIFATVATTALISYVHGLEQKAFAGTESVQVYVARAIIPQGTSADSAVQGAAIERTTVPRKVVAEGAIRSLDEIRGKVAGVTIMPGEQILAARFVAPGSTSGLAIPEGRQAMAVEVDVPPGVAGFVQPGDRVSVLAKVDLSKETVVRFLLQNVQVLQVGPRIATTQASGDREAARNQSRTVSDKVLLTLAVTPAEAEKLGYAVLEGDVYFTLLPSGQKPVKTGGRTTTNLFR